MSSRRFRRGEVPSRRAHGRRDLRPEALERRALLAAQPVDLADASLYGASGLKASSAPSISADGQLVAFASAADNLVPNDHDGTTDAFVYDRGTGAVILASVGSNGQAAGIGGYSSPMAPVISPDGRYVAFENNAGNVLPGATGDQLYVRDLTTGTTTLVSAAASGTGGGNSTSLQPIFSADSRHLLFLSTATNLVVGVKFNGVADLYERDLTTGTTDLVSVSLDGKSGGSAGSGPAAISADGRFVAFQSSAQNLTAIGTGGSTQIFERDMDAGTTTMLSVDTTGLAPATGGTSLDTGSTQLMSSDGRYVVFDSYAANLVAGPPSGKEIYVHDLLTGKNTRVSVSALTGQGVGGGGSEIISPDGRYVAFATSTSGVVSLPTNGQANVYVKDLKSGTLTLASVDAAGNGGGNAGSGLGTFYDFPGGLSFSPDGHEVAFRSKATNLTAGVATGNRNLYVRDLSAGRTILVSVNRNGTDGGAGDADTVGTAALSADGRYVAFEDTAGDLVAGDNNRANDIFVRDLAAGTTALASARSPLLPAAFPAQYGGTLGSVSADGRYVAFTSPTYSYSDLLPNQVFVNTFGDLSVFVRDRQTGALQVADVTPDGKAVGGFHPVLSAGGRTVVFLSHTAALLPAGVTSRGAADLHNAAIYLRHLDTGTTTLVSATPDRSQATDVTNGAELAVSADGNYIAYTSPDPGAVAGVSDPNGYTAVYVYDVRAGTTTLVSHDPANDGQIRGRSFDISISADGRYVAFLSTDPGLTGQSVSSTQVFRWDRSTGQVALASVNAAGTGPGNNNGDYYQYAPSMSPDGRYIAFASYSTDLPAGVGSGAGADNVFVRDFAAGTTTLVSTNAAGTGGGNSNSYAPSISADGRRVAFASDATNLTALPDANHGTDVFVRDLAAGTTTLISANSAGTAAATGPNGPSSTSPRISPDGRYVAFVSSDSDLISGYVSGNGNRAGLYLRDLSTGLIRLVTVDLSGSAGSNADESNDDVQFSADSSTLAFDSGASDLFAGDFNGSTGPGGYTNATDVFATSTAGFGGISGEVFYDANGNGTLDAGETGLPYWTVYLDTNGNGVPDPGEPSEMTDASGHYAFSGLLPGTYRVAVVPQAGYQETSPGGSGTYSITVADGSVASGKTFGEEIGYPDLAVSTVAFSPTSAAPGHSVTATWTATDTSPVAASGSWEDVVYLSPTPTLAPDAVPVALAPHAGGLAGLGHYKGSATFVVPAQVGTYYAIVRVDRRNQVDEGPSGAGKANDVAASASTLAVTIPALTLGVPATGALSPAAEDQYYQVTAPAGGSLLLGLASAAGSGEVELYVKRGALPAPYDFDFAARTPGQPGQLLTIPAVQPGVYYILVHGVDGAAAASRFTLAAAQPGLSLLSPGLTSGGNGGRVTIPVHGTDLTPATQVSLVSGGTVVAPVSIDFRDASLLYATFDLSGRAPGAYSLRVSDGGHSATLPGAFTVTPARGPNLQVHLSTPDAIRANTHTTKLTVELTVDYANDGDTDMPAPIFQLTTDMGSLALLSGGAPTIQDVLLSGVLQVIGNGGDSPGGVLRAGDHGRATILLALPTTVILAGGGGGGGSKSITVGKADGVTVTLSTLPTDTTPVNWDQFKSQLQPPSVPNAAWDVVWNSFTSAVGSTYGQLQSKLVSDTAYLNQIGVASPTYDQILGFEMMRADAALPVPTLGSTTDLSYPAPGLTLEFDRAFSQPTSGRYRLGTLGRGWVSNWDISATTLADGSVVISDAGAPRLFEKAISGGYAAQPGDYGTLTAANGRVQLREKDGTVLAFRPDGRLDYEQDTHGNRITAGYDAAGRLASLTHSDGASLSIAYNAQGRIASVTDPAGRVATYTYDASGEHLIAVTTAQGTTHYGYVTGGNAAQMHALASIANPDGSQVHYSYDAQGRLSGMSQGDPSSPVDPVAITYPTPGGVVFTDPSGSTTVAFNQLGLPSLLTDPLGHTTAETYDGAGNLTSLLLPGGLSYQYAYNARGDLTKVTDPLGNATTFTYAPGTGQLSGYRDPKGNATAYAYNAQGDLRSITYPDGSHQNLSYDPLGNLQSFVNARGDAVDVTHNADGRVAKETFADGSHEDYIYDTHGNLTSASLTDAQGKTTATILHYDAADRLTGVDEPGGLSLAFTYNALGQRIRSVDQTGYTINYRYDPAGRLSGLIDGSGDPIVTYLYNSSGRLAEKDLGNGTYATYQYDAAGELLHLVNHAPRPAAGQDGPVNSRFDYTYDDLGQVRTETTSDGVWTYTYDADGQLTHAVFASNDPAAVPNQDLQYAYDAAGNRTRAVINGVTTTYTSNALDEYTQVGTTTYTYDADGNLASKTEAGVTTTYSFNELNQLIGVSSPSGSAGYAYDPLGSLVATTQNGQTTRYLIDPTGYGGVPGMGNRIGEFNGTAPDAHYAYGLGLVERADSGGAAYYDLDAIGSVVGLTNAAGSYTDRYNYLPFGETFAATAALPNPFTYVGGFGVVELAGGLLHMGQRAYDPRTGQFTADDPTGLRGGDANLRRYALNSPTGSIDPGGLETISQQDWDQMTSVMEGRLTLADAGHPVSIQDSLPGYSKAVLFDSPWWNDKTYDIQGGPLKGRRMQGHEINYYFQGMIARHYGISRFDLLASIFTWKGVMYHQLPSRDTLLSAIAGYQLSKTIPIVGSFDPNNLVGPSGFGSRGWISQAPQTLSYSVQFENDPKKATAAAQDITVTERLAPGLDWSTFQLGPIQFGSITLNVPDGLQSYATSVDTTNMDGTPLRVGVSASLDRLTGVVTWTFHSVDPSTGLAPLDPYAGFLPVEDNTGRGTGTVFYTVRPHAGLVDGTTIGAQASVVFDVNPAIATNAVSNAVDAAPPTSAVKPLPGIVSTPTFTVSWSGADAAGSGVATYSVYVAIDGGPYRPFLTNTTATSAPFTGVVGHSYRFYSVATDNVGNAQATPAVAQASTRVSAAAATATATVFSDHPGGSTYGQAVRFVASVGGAAGTPTGTVQFVVDGAAFGSPVALTNGTAVSPALATLGAGVHHVAAVYSGDAAYAALVSPVLTTAVAPAPLTIVANSTARIYGQPNLLFAASYAGFVDGDTPASLATPVTLSTAANATSPPGIYAITPSGAWSRDYAITFLSGSLAVIPAPADASPAAQRWAAFATTLYEEVLGRNPDLDGLSFWVRTLGSGISPEAVTLAFWNSREHALLMATGRAPRITPGTALKDAQAAGRVALGIATAVPRGPLALSRAWRVGRA